MSAELMQPPGGGRRIAGGGIDATLKASTAEGAFASVFDVVIPPGYDVGAHLHGQGQEMFYVIEGELDILAFEPLDRSVRDWHRWRSSTGQTFLRGGPGAFMWVPPGTPHAFANATDQPVRMFFQSSVPGGHENYLAELASILSAGDGPPDQAAIGDLRRRYDIDQLTDVKDRR